MTAEPTPTPNPRRRPLLALVPPPLAFFGAFAGMVAIDRFAPGPLLWAWPFNLAGAVLMALGGVLAIAAVVTFHRADVSPRLFEGSHTVIDHGPFRFSRNPMYLSLVITAAGIATWMGHMLPYVGPVALFLWFDRVFIPREEAVLTDHFGSGWRDYTARVRRWI